MQELTITVICWYGVSIQHGVGELYCGLCVHGGRRLGSAGTVGCVGWQEGGSLLSWLIHVRRLILGHFVQTGNEGG